VRQGLIFFRRHLQEKKAERLKEYKTVALNYYNFATQLFHKIWSPHYSMGIGGGSHLSFALF
jgi:hypothetical protein